MRTETIREVGIDEEERLYLCPLKTAFDQIYRSAMEVHWDANRKRLFGPRPREWTYLRWFEQIIAAAAQEYGVQLRITPSTVWSNVPPELRAAISGSAA